MNSNEFLTTAEVASICRTSPSTVRYWRYIGKGPESIKPGKTVLYPRQAVEHWIDDLRSGSRSLDSAGAR